MHRLLCEPEAALVRYDDDSPSDTVPECHTDACADRHTDGVADLRAERSTDDRADTAAGGGSYGLPGCCDILV
jgi:hypothetical protein